MSQEQLNIKLFLNSYLTEHELGSKNVVFKLYTVNDDVYNQFSRKDWEMIFPSVNEAEFNQWLHRDDMVMLTSFYRGSSTAFGFLCFQAVPNCSTNIYFHGGTWFHSMREQMYAYEGLIYLLKFFWNEGFEILVTCLKNNAKSNRFLNSLGFVEFDRDDRLLYKYLDIEKFVQSPIVKRFL